MFVLPEIYFKIVEKIGKIAQSFGPLFHPTEIHLQRHTTEENASQEAIQKEYHIHAFLRKKYRPKTSEMFKKESSKYYLYTLLRQKKTLFLSKK